MSDAPMADHTQQTVLVSPSENGRSQPGSPALTKTPKKPSIEDYQVVKSLGHGSFGEVVLAKHKLDKKKVAIKMLSKAHMEKTNSHKSAMAEREFLSLFRARQVPALYSCFQDNSFLYYVMEYSSGGNLEEYLAVQKQLPLAEVKRLTAEIVLALELLRSYGVCHRDLKPQNIVYDSEGHIKLVDFGCAKLYERTELNDKSYDRVKKILLEYEKKFLIQQNLEENDDVFDETPQAQAPHELVGSALFAAPEMLINGYSDFEVDHWALGILLHYLVFGKYPFEENSQSQYQLFKQICSGDISIPQTNPPVDETAVDLIRKLLTRDPKKRLGCGRGDAESINGFSKLKRHEFFKDIDYETLFIEKGLKALRQQGVTSTGNTSNDGSFQNSTISSSLSSSNNVTLASLGKKTEVLARVHTNRKKFLFVEVSGHLTLFSDHTLRYDQIYDNTSRVFKLKKLTKMEFNRAAQTINIEVKSEGKKYELKVSDGVDAFAEFEQAYNECKVDTGSRVIVGDSPLV